MRSGNAAGVGRVRGGGPAARRLAPAATALAERPSEEDDEFALDVRVLVAYGPITGDCPTDDGCGNTCQGNDSACNSFADDPS